MLNSTRPKYVPGTRVKIIGVSGLSDPSNLVGNVGTIVEFVGDKKIIGKNNSPNVMINNAYKVDIPAMPTNPGKSWFIQEIALIPIDDDAEAKSLRESFIAGNWNSCPWNPYKSKINV